MIKSGSLLFLLTIILITFINVIGDSGCANMAPPMGGPRDSLPPVLISSKPADSAKNFTGKKINFEFNEFVELDNVQENLLVSPVPRIPPTVERKLKTVTVTINDTLLPNTTYTLDFGNAIKDLNEGNPLKNFTYMFSTGKSLDSLRLTGKVIIAETGLADSTMIVLLHSSRDDSAVIKKTPRYIARLDKSGSFTFRNLPDSSYRLYALKNEGRQMKYISIGQFFAFEDSAVRPQVAPKPVTLYAYKERDTATNKPVVAPTAPPTRPAGNRRVGDVTVQDKRLKFATNISGGIFDLLDTLRFSFPVQIKYFDSTKVAFTNEKFEPITNFRYIKDTSNTKVTLIYNWTENTPYNLILDKDFAEDTAGRKIPRIDTIEFRTKKNSDYGLVRLRFPNLDLSKNPVLQFVQSDQVKYSYIFAGGKEFYAKLFVPGDYNLRILFDDNKNGIWDPGEFFGKHIQPEKVRPISRKLSVKPNWDNEVDITL